MTQYTTNRYLIDKAKLDAEFQDLKEKTKVYGLSVLPTMLTPLQLAIRLKRQVPNQPDVYKDKIRLSLERGFGNELVEQVMAWVDKVLELETNKASLGDTFRPDQVIHHIRDKTFLDPVTYCQNWNFINTFKDEVSKRTAFGFINSTLYRGEKLFMWSEEDTITLVAFRNCSDEAQTIIEKAAEK